MPRSINLVDALQYATLRSLEERRGGASLAQAPHDEMGTAIEKVVREKMTRSSEPPDPSSPSTGGGDAVGDVVDSSPGGQDPGGVSGGPGGGGGGSTFRPL